MTRPRTLEQDASAQISHFRHLSVPPPPPIALPFPSLTRSIHRETVQTESKSLAADAPPSCSKHTGRHVQSLPLKSPLGFAVYFEQGQLSTRPDQLCRLLHRRDHLHVLLFCHGSFPSPLFRLIVLGEKQTSDHRCEQIDDFSVVSVPCTHAVPDCSLREATAQAACGEEANSHPQPLECAMCIA